MAGGIRPSSGPRSGSPVRGAFEGSRQGIGRVVGDQADGFAKAKTDGRMVVHKLFFVDRWEDGDAY